jgi:hypothetical protein
MGNEKNIFRPGGDEDSDLDGSDDDDDDDNGGGKDGGKGAGSDGDNADDKPEGDNGGDGSGDSDDERKGGSADGEGGGSDDGSEAKEPDKRNKRERRKQQLVLQRARPARVFIPTAMRVDPATGRSTARRRDAKAALDRGSTVGPSSNNTVAGTASLADSDCVIQNLGSGELDGSDGGPDSDTPALADTPTPRHGRRAPGAPVSGSVLPGRAGHGSQVTTRTVRTSVGTSVASSCGFSPDSDLVLTSPSGVGIGPLFSPNSSVMSDRPGSRGLVPTLSLASMPLASGSVESLTQVPQKARGPSRLGKRKIAVATDPRWESRQPVSRG